MWIYKTHFFTGKVDIELVTSFMLDVHDRIDTGTPVQIMKTELGSAIATWILFNILFLKHHLGDPFTL